MWSIILLLFLVLPTTASSLPQWTFKLLPVMASIASLPQVLSTYTYIHIHTHTHKHTQAYTSTLTCNTSTNTHTWFLLEYNS
jgi:carbohydrate-binding DOMON domain-containing protein